MAERSDYTTEIKEKFKQIDLSDGASKEEAIIIAQNHLIENGLSKDYVVTRPKVADLHMFNQWEVTFKATYGESIKKGNVFGLIGIFKWWIAVSVDKKTGKVMSTGGPDL